MRLPLLSSWGWGGSWVWLYHWLVEAFLSFMLVIEFGTICIQSMHFVLELWPFLICCPSWLIAVWATCEQADSLADSLSHLPFLLGVLDRILVGTAPPSPVPWVYIFFYIFSLPCRLLFNIVFKGSFTHRRPGEINGHNLVMFIDSHKSILSKMKLNTTHHIVWIVFHW